LTSWPLKARESTSFCLRAICNNAPSTAPLFSAFFWILAAVIVLFIYLYKRRTIIKRKKDSITKYDKRMQLDDIGLNISLHSSFSIDKRSTRSITETELEFPMMYFNTQHNSYKRNTDSITEFDDEGSQLDVIDWNSYS